MPFTIVRQDITKMEVDAIVNAANTDLLMGGGVCGAIFRAAGQVELQTACNELGPIKTGQAVITPGFNLPSKYIIHTTGPVYKEDRKEESEKSLRLAYTNSLKLALENQCESIAFPLISSGIYGYPKREALQVARSAIEDFLRDHDLNVSLAILDKGGFFISQELVGEVENYLEDKLHFTRTRSQRDLLDVERQALYGETILEERMEIFTPQPASLDDLVGNLDESFSQMLLRLIDTKGMTDVEVYRAANLDRRLFSKIKNQKGYMPSKRTALALALALKLNLEETDDFLKRAGYALSHALKFDVIVEYFIIKEKYNILEINELLFHYDQPLLGGSYS